MNKLKIGKKIWILMQEKQMSKYRLCKLANIQTTQLNNILKGKGNYTIDTLLSIFEVLDYSII